MLTKIEIRGRYTNLLERTLNFQDAANDAVQVQGADGLGPVKAEITTVPYGAASGSHFQGARVGERNIVLTLGLAPDWATQTVAELRNELYLNFMPGKEVQLWFYSTHMEVVRIYGWVETVDPEMFSKDPTTTVSIICPEPWFAAIAQKTAEGFTFDPTGTPPVVPVAINLPANAFSEGPVIKIGGPGSSDNQAANGTLQRIITNGSEFQAGVTLGDGYTAVVSSVFDDRYIHHQEYPNVSLMKWVNMYDDWPTISPPVTEVTVLASHSEPNDVGYPWSLYYYVYYGAI